MCCTIFILNMSSLSCRENDKRHSKFLSSLAGCPTPTTKHPIVLILSNICLDGHLYERFRTIQSVQNSGILEHLKPLTKSVFSPILVSAGPFLSSRSVFLPSDSYTNVIKIYLFTDILHIDCKIMYCVFVYVLLKWVLFFFIFIYTKALQKMFCKIQYYN